MKMAAKSPHQAVMAFLERRKSFWLSEVVKATGIERRRLLRVLDKLRGEGYLALTDEQKNRPQMDEHGPYRRNPKYRLVGDISKRTRRRPECARDKIWRTIRHLKKQPGRISSASADAVRSRSVIIPASLRNTAISRPPEGRGVKRSGFWSKISGRKNLKSMKEADYERFSW